MVTRPGTVARRIFQWSLSSRSPPEGLMRQVGKLNIPRNELLREPSAKTCLHRRTLILRLPPHYSLVKVTRETAAIAIFSKEYNTSKERLEEREAPISVSRSSVASAPFVSPVSHFSSVGSSPVRNYVRIRALMLHQAPADVALD